MRNLLLNWPMAESNGRAASQLRKYMQVHNHVEISMDIKFCPVWMSVCASLGYANWTATAS